MSLRALRLTLALLQRETEQRQPRVIERVVIQRQRQDLVQNQATFLGMTSV